MTDEGKTNYFRLKGLAGEAICDADPDCEDGRYLTVRSCRPQSVQGGEGPARFARAAKNAPPGRSASKCAVANECMADPHCGTAAGDKGLADLGRNICETKLADGRACTGWPSAVSELSELASARRADQRDLLHARLQSGG